MGVLSASSPSKSNLPDNGSLAGPMHRARAKTQSRVGVRGGVVRSATAGDAMEACAAYAGVPEGAVCLSAAGAGASMQAWWRKARFKAVVLCRQPPNHAFEGSAQQRARCWVPSSLRSSAPPQRERWAACWASGFCHAGLPSWLSRASSLRCLRSRRVVLAIQVPRAPSIVP